MRSPFPFALLLAALLTLGPAQAQETLRIAAVVNDEIISAYDLSSRLALVLASSGTADNIETRRRLAPQVLRGLIDDKLKLQEARRLNISITMDDIQLALAQVERQNDLPKGGLDGFLARTGINKSVLIDQLEAEIAWIKAVSRKLAAKIQIGDDEIDEIIARIEANKGKPDHLVSEIFLPIDDPLNQNEIQLLANRLFQQLKDGASFPALAQNFSQSASAAVGGDLDWISPGQLGSDLNAALLKLQPGQISPPIPSMAGFYILLLRDRRTGQGLTDKEVGVSLQQLFLPLSPNAGQAEVASQMELASTMSEVAGNCQDMEALGKEFDPEMSGNLGKVNMSQLPGKLRPVVEKLPLGKASRPLRIADGIIVIMVCEREEAPSALKARVRIKRMLFERRVSTEARHYLYNLRRAAFIDVRL